MEREATPARDDPDAEDFDATAPQREGVSDQLPETAPREAIPDDEEDADS